MKDDELERLIMSLGGGSTQEDALKVKDEVDRRRASDQEFRLLALNVIMDLVALKELNRIPCWPESVENLRRAL